MKQKAILLIDMQSFYASVEKVDFPQYKDRPLIVSGDPERRSGIILAACPLAKAYGIVTAEALWQAKEKCPDVIIMKPRMQRYIDVSIEITAIMKKFTDLVEPFSIDEQFMDVTGSQRLFGDPFQIAQKVQSEILRGTGIYARCGIGPNKVLAKMACDNFAKKNDNGIFRLDETNLEKELWPLPIGKLFGVGHKMEYHLRRLAIHDIGRLANYPLEILKKRWGINGEVLWRTAHGIDAAPVTVKTHEKQKAIGHHMTLPRDYEQYEDIKVVLLELCREVARRAGKKKYIGSTVSIGARSADFDNPSGFHSQTKLPFLSNFDMDIYNEGIKIFNKNWDRHPIRSIGVTLSGLQTAEVVQMNLFNDIEKRLRLSEAMGKIENKYGNTALLRASSLMSAGQVFERAKKIGGHYK